MKGQISIIEAILSGVVLFVAFSMIINTGEYQTKWKDSISSMQGRDILITVDRLGKLHDYSFSASFTTEFLSRIDTTKDSIVKLDTQGTVLNTIYIACDCTSEQVAYLQIILSDIKFNNRELTTSICSTILPAIETCGSNEKYPDILVIWGYKDLSPYINILSDFAKEGNGILEIADLDELQASNVAQGSVFGIKWINQGNFPTEEIQFMKPLNASLSTYQSYKWFYHLPYTLNPSQDADPFQMEDNSIIACVGGKTAEFRSDDNNYDFWVCPDSLSGNKVYFDTDQPQNGKANTANVTGDIIPIQGNRFRLNYIDSASKTRISFKPDYKFNDFLFVDNSHNKIYPSDDDKNKILLHRGYWDLALELPVSVAIVNKYENGLTGWMPDFGRNGLADTGDDHKQLIASLVLSLSSKNMKETLQQTGQITSYINVNNTDMLEIYKVDLSIGKPF